ncbi:MAG: type II toxin-antitoxin system RelE/ParE family toxin [Flavobacteriales bacterium]
MKNELIELSEKLLNNPKLGESLGNNCFKVRLAIRSKGKGKSGGARIITHFYIEENTIYLLTIYDKSEVESISDKELKELLKLIK